MTHESSPSAHVPRAGSLPYPSIERVVCRASDPSEIAALVHQCFPGARDSLVLLSISADSYLGVSARVPLPESVEDPGPVCEALAEVARVMRREGARSCSVLAIGPRAGVRELGAWCTVAAAALTSLPSPVHLLVLADTVAAGVLAYEVIATEQDSPGVEEPGTSGAVGTSQDRADGTPAGLEGEARRLLSDSGSLALGPGHEVADPRRSSFAAQAVGAGVPLSADAPGPIPPGAARDLLLEAFERGLAERASSAADSEGRALERWQRILERGMARMLSRPDVSACELLGALAADFCDTRTEAVLLPAIVCHGAAVAAGADAAIEALSGPGAIRPATTVCPGGDVWNGLEGLRLTLEASARSDPRMVTSAPSHPLTRAIAGVAALQVVLAWWDCRNATACELGERLTAPETAHPLARLLPALLDGSMTPGWLRGRPDLST